MIGKAAPLPRNRRLYYALLVTLVALVSWVALMLPMRDRLRPAALGAGQVAGQDYLAGSSLTYTSEVLTLQKQTEAENSVIPFYTAPDISIARRESDKLREALAYMDGVRADSVSTQTQKLANLGALADVHLSQNVMEDLLALSEARWQAVSQGASLALERVMGNAIRPENLEIARRNVPGLVSLSLSPAEADIAAQLAASFVAPNSFYSEADTLAMRQSARESVTPAKRSFVAGQTVARRGQVLSEADIEALQQLGLVEQPLQWKEPVGAAALVLLMIFFILLYFRRDPSLLGKPRRLTIIAALFILFLLSARLVVPFHVILPYAFPLAAYSLTVVALFGSQLAMVTSLPLSLMAAYALPNAFDLTIYYLAASLLGVLALGGARRVASYLWSGATVALAGILVIVAYRLVQPASDWTGVITLGGVAMFNGLATASLTILLQFLLAQALGAYTPMQLVELTRPDQPLLQKLLREAPGTYQHSLQVANLAEQAAERIRADPLLTRVGALYHDAGKLANPLFFIENLPPGVDNPHNTLEPQVSAQYIIRHVADGLEIGRKNHLPKRVLDFIAEHHGVTLARYQYIRAVKQVGGDESQVDAEKFRYPGPRPHSRETAILMLADGCEARVRAERPKEEDLRELITLVVDDRRASGQLDHTSLTLNDLSEIIDIFYVTLRAVYHPRIIYPQLEIPSSSEIATRPNGQASTTHG
jgi:cyclic-di-AMP phosphodiesterase PgpH